ncbi:MAG: DUF3737 family protein [Deltaproteobacteria bacterium]|nr:MAG: DUF3737 family protein [Deltaproteobacteria bacterium]
MRFIDRTFDEERALYGVRGAQLLRCTFDGPADGESALKESADLTVSDTDFHLRYPLWHATHATLTDSRMSEGCRAALWYCDDLALRGCELRGIKALRECTDVTIRDSVIASAELGWRCDGVRIAGSSIASEYPFLFATHLDLERVTLTGKYSFQYVADVTIRGSHLETKDAFWHSRNVTVYDSVLEGEYLGWYSENLRLVRCTLKGTQPLCYAHGLVLEDCTMIGCDLAFENSEVNATVTGTIDSVKNPRSGRIVADAIGRLIDDGGAAEPGACEVICRSEHAPSGAALEHPRTQRRGGQTCHCTA